MPERAPLGSALLARARTRSDDPETTAWPIATSPIHPYTGRFADPEQTVAFSSNVFRLMFPLHFLALTLLDCVAVSVVLALGTGDTPGQPLVTYFLVSSFLALVLGARITLHQLKDQTKAQQYGAMAWTMTVVAGCTADFFAYVLHSKPACNISSMYVYPLFSVLFAILNGLHGMEFWHTALLAGLVLCDFMTVRVVCGNSPPVDLALVALVVVFTAVHFAQLLGRKAFLQTERLQTSRERLEYDVLLLQFGKQRAESKLPAVFPPTESSTNSSTPPLTTQSAPAAAREAGRPAPVAHHELGLPSISPDAADFPTIYPISAVPSSAAAPIPSCEANGGAQTGLSSANGNDPPTASPGVPLDVRAPSQGPPGVEHCDRLAIFSMPPEERAQQFQLAAQMKAERLVVEQADGASDALSQHGSALSPAWSTWSSSSPSTATRKMRKMRKVVYELVHGISAPASAAESQRSPYI